MSLAEVSCWGDTIWLTNQLRTDQDLTIFGSVTYDFDQRWSASVGLRWFRNENSLFGFFGFNENYNPTYGTAHCFSDRQFRGSPCTNLDADSTTDGTVPKFTLTYSFDPTRLVYVTYSEGYRPGGANRNVGAARVDGVEAAVDWVLTEQLTVSGGFTWLDSRLTKDYVTVEDGEPEAFDGDPMPIAPDFRPT